MKKTLLAIDIGNTHIDVGLFKGKKLVKEVKLLSQEIRKEKDALSLLKKSFKAEVELGVVASVVPPLTKVFQRALIKLTDTMPVIVNPHNCDGLKLKVDQPKEVGADRIVNCVAAHKLYKGNAIVIDFGTAITFDLVSAKKEYLGGVIAPGIGMSAEALYSRTALLPQIDLKRPKKAVGKNTQDCLQSGIYYNAVGLIETLIPRLKKELGWKRPKIVLTGGMAPLISSELSFAHQLEPQLTLQGLRTLGS